MAKLAATTKKTKPLSKSEVVNALADAIGEEVSRKHMTQVVEILVDVGHKELKKNGIFVLHGFAKFVVVSTRSRDRRMIAEWQS
jgi:nucleoid DNA-binding protein